MEKSYQASIHTSPYWRQVGCTLHGTTWKCTHAKNYVNYTVMLLFESPSGTKLNKKALLSKAFFFVCRKARRVAAQRVREDISRFEAT
jgi:hypothetical protein